MLTIIIEALKDTLIMVFLSGFLTICLGLPLGMIMYGSKFKSFFKNNLLFNGLNWIVSLISSAPYLVVVIFCLPITNWMSTNDVPVNLAAIIPITIASIPLYAARVYKVFSNLPEGFATTGKALGATAWQTLTKMYLPETFPNLIKEFTWICKQLVNYSVIAGFLGAGGLGQLLLQKGYLSFSLSYVTIVALLLIILTQLFQYLGYMLAEQSAKI